MESSKHDWTLSGTAKSFQFMNFSEAMFYESNLTSDFHTKTVISSLFAYSFKMASKTVIRPIQPAHTHKMKVKVLEHAP